jgi:hypothetical protein
MFVLGRCRSFLRGLLWLGRGTGLRAHLHQLDDRVDRVDQRLATTVPLLDAVQNQRSGEDQSLVAACVKLDQNAVMIQALEARLRDTETRLTQALAQANDTEIRRRQVQAWRAVGDLRGFEFKITSQNGEDGILEEIFRRLGTTNRHFVEFGVGSGLECNCAYLARAKQWSGLFMEARPSDYAELQERYRDLPTIRCIQAAVTSRNIELLLGNHGVPEELDLLSIDIDSNDYWVWAAINRWHPRVVVMEYNPFHLPPKKWVMKEDDSYRWNHTTYFGASLTSLTLLAQRKGYDLVGTDSRGVNCFFVRKDCIRPGMFLDPVLQYHFTPFGYPPPRPLDGPYVEV